MSNATPPPIDERALEPPLVDWLHQEEGAFLIGFIPSGAVSEEPIETARVAQASADGRAIEAFLLRIAQVLGVPSPITRVAHGGSIDYTLHFANGAVVALPNPTVTPLQTHETLDRLRQIAACAQSAFAYLHAA